MKRILVLTTVMLMMSVSLVSAGGITGGTTSGSDTPPPSNNGQSSRISKDDAYKLVEKGANHFIPGVGTVTVKSLKGMEWAAEKQIESGGRVGLGSTVKK